MRYLERPASEPLSRFVRCIWALECAPASAPPQDRVLPDGCVELIVQYGDSCGAGSRDPASGQPGEFLIGQIRTGLLLEPRQIAGVLGVRFHPAGAGPFFRIPMHELTGTEAALSDVAPSIARDLADAVRSAATQHGRIAAAELALAPYACRARRRRGAASEAAERLVRASGSERIGDLCADLATSGRTLERRFRDDVGLTPKTLARILRFQTAVRTLRDRTESSLVGAAISCGYADQAHFTREFTEFAGESPLRWLRGSHPVAGLFVS